MHLFFRVLVAGVAINLCEFLVCYSICSLLYRNNANTVTTQACAEVCVMVGLSSEVCLLPTTNEICDF